MTVLELKFQCETLIEQGKGDYRVFVDWDKEGGNESEARGLEEFKPFWSKDERNFKLE